MSASVNVHSGYLWRKGDGVLPFQRSWSRYPFVLTPRGMLELRSASGAVSHSIPLTHATIRAIVHAKHADCFEISRAGASGAAPTATRLRAPSSLALLEFFDRVARAAFDGTIIDRGALAGREAALRAAASPLMTPAPARTASRVGVSAALSREAGAGTAAGEGGFDVREQASATAGAGSVTGLFADADDGSWDVERTSSRVPAQIPGGQLAAVAGSALTAVSPVMLRSASAPPLSDDGQAPSPSTPPTTPPASPAPYIPTARTPAASPPFVSPPRAALLSAVSPSAEAAEQTAASATPETARALSPTLIDTVTPRNGALTMGPGSSRSGGAWWLSPDPQSPLVSPVSEFAPDSIRFSAPAASGVAEGAAIGDDEFDDYIELPLLGTDSVALQADGSAAPPAAASPPHQVADQAEDLPASGAASTVFLSSSPRTVFLSASPRACERDQPSIAGDVGGGALVAADSGPFRPGTTLSSTLSSPEQRFLSMIDGDAAVRALIAAPRFDSVKDNNLAFPAAQNRPSTALPATPARASSSVFESSVLPVQYASAAALSPVRGDVSVVPFSDDVTDGSDAWPEGGRPSPLAPVSARLAFWPSPAPALKPFAYEPPRAILRALEIALPRSPARSTASSTAPSAPQSASPSPPPSPPRTPLLHAHAAALSIDEFEALVLSLDEFEDMLSEETHADVAGEAGEVPSAAVASAPPSRFYDARPHIAYLSPRRSPAPQPKKPRVNTGATIAATVAAQRELVAAASAWRSSALLKSLAESAAAPSPARPQTLAVITLESAMEERAAARGAALARVFERARGGGSTSLGERRAASVGHVIVNARPQSAQRIGADRGKTTPRTRAGSVGASAGPISAMRRPASRVNVSVA